MKVHAVQQDIVWEDKLANFARVRELLAAAKPEPGSLIVLPEMFATGFSMNLAATREVNGGETELFLRDLATSYKCCVVGGLVDEGRDGLGRNVALAVGPDGAELARYAKMQPFSLGKEDAVHEAGESVVTFAFGGFTIAPLICYDLRFPEHARTAVQQGADVLVYIASWPLKRAQHWVTLLQARAIENLAWVIGVNRCGADQDFKYPGRTLVVDPHGCIIADAADREGVIVTNLDRVVSDDWRAQFPALRDRRM